MIVLSMLVGCGGATPEGTPFAVPMAAEAPMRVESGEPLVAGAETHRPAKDWGGTVFLSNDDSMSLASAQHVLHAVKNGLPLSPSEIRPHEVLNYFTFLPADVAAGHRFSVRGSADKVDDDTLAVGLTVHGAVPDRRPLDLTLIIDRSGSMKEEGRMTYVKRGLREMASHLVPGDRVDVVLFDDEATVALNGWKVGRDLRPLTNVIDALQPRNGTDIGVGLREGYRLASRGNDGRNHRVLLLTDALANQGDIDPASLAAVAAGYQQHGIRLTGVGVGVGFDDRILDTVTESGHGGYVYLGSEAVVDRVFGAGFDALVETVATDVRFELQLPPSLAMERFHGEEASTVAAEVQSVDFAAGTTQLFLQDLSIDSAKAGGADPVVLTVSYQDDGERRSERFEMTLDQLLESDRHDLRKGRALLAWTDVVAARAMGGSPCGAPWSTFEARAKSLDDAEIGYVRELVADWCPAPSAYKVKVNSDVPVDAVRLACGGESWTETLGATDTIAMFTAPAGSCTLTLDGKSAAVTVPRAGGAVNCLVRADRLACG